MFGALPRDDGAIGAMHGAAPWSDPTKKMLLLVFLEGNGLSREFIHVY